MAKLSVPNEKRSQRGKRMVAEMSNARTVVWVGVALVLHGVVIVGTSFGYIREHWLGAKPAEAKAADETPASPATPPAAAPAANVATPTPAAQAHAEPAALPGGISDDDKKLAERRNSPVVKSVTESAKPGELPKTPQHNAFDIDDTPK